MKTHELVFTQPYQVELQEREIDTSLDPHQALVESECSIRTRAAGTALRAGKLQ